MNTEKSLKIEFSESELESMKKVCGIVSYAIGHCFTTPATPYRDPTENMDSSTLNEISTFVWKFRKLLNGE